MMFRFTIRDLLWLTVVVALGVAWWVDHGMQKKTIRQLAEHLLRLQASGERGQQLRIYGTPVPEEY